MKLSICPVCRRDKCYIYCMLKLHHNPAQLYAPFQGSHVGFVARYCGIVGDGTKESSSSIFRIYTEDKTVVDLIKLDDFHYH